MVAPVHPRPSEPGYNNSAENRNKNEVIDLGNISSTLETSFVEKMQKKKPSKKTNYSKRKTLANGVTDSHSSHRHYPLEIKTNGTVSYKTCPKNGK